MPFCYVPVLKAKEGELIALRNLEPDTKAVLMPLIELQPREKQSLLERTLNKIRRSWELKLPLLLDVDNDYLVNDTASAVNNFRTTFEELSSNNFNVIPVTGLRRPTPFKNLISNNIDVTSKGLCIRLQSIDWQDVSTLENRLRDFVRSLSLNFNKVDLVLDYESFLPSHVGTIITSAIATINSISHINNYRNLIFTATAFPSQPPSQPYTVFHLPRSEYYAWSTLVANPGLKRKPIFGDYTTIHPVLPDIDFKYGIKIAPKIKYATESEWIYLKWDAGDYDTFRQICETLVGLPEFSGGDYSWGDGRIAQCAGTGQGTGNPREWVSIGVNHHLTLAAEQCSSHPAV
jgi:hypothetical protein